MNGFSLHIETARILTILFNKYTLHNFNVIKAIPFDTEASFLDLHMSISSDIVSWSRGQISNFEFCCTPQEEKVGYYFQSGTCLGASETHVLLSFLLSILCKWPVITVTPQTLKIAVHKIQD